MSTIATPSTASPPATAAPFRWSRLWTPSFADIFFLSILALSFLASNEGWQRLLQDGDTALHLRLGEYMVSHATVPREDPISFVKGELPFIAWEWGSDVIFWLLHQAWGLKGVVFFCGVLIAAFLTVLLRYCLDLGANGLIAMLCVLTAGNAASMHYHARPHLFTMLFLVVTGWLVSRDRRQQTRWIWALVPLTLVWANLHAGFVILFVYLVLLVAGTAYHDRQAAMRYGWVAAACAAVTLINPLGMALHHEIFRYLTDKSILASVDEAKAPAFRNEAELQFLLLLFIGLGLCGLLLRRGKLVEVLWILAGGYFALTSVRHITIYVIMATPVIAAELTDWWNRMVADLPRTSIARVFDDVAAALQRQLQSVSIWPVAALAAIFCLSPASSWPSDFPAKSFPTALVHRQESLLRRSRVFTTDQWADYLMYNNRPDQKVFFDDRAFYGNQIVGDALAMMAGEPQWRQLLDKYRLDAVLCPSSAALATLLKADPNWKAVDSDKTATLFRRRAL